ncbi:amino acid adenylation domain-containing protein [Marilutibacter chinensis]|uniref:Amino acid adenylation domain-containing protein n=1 Tax=Marilutibacter chinensis TaxID=2912247 RepID=A0ABS9HX19_9GAMM|nr:amino acid adenylation domain-containing protein [Lysobacter chinensis]
MAYHIPAALRLKGHLDRDALKRALDRIVARHENLRTSFTSTDAGPVQSIAAETIGFALVEEDLASLDAPAREQALRARAAEEARAPFDLAAGPLFRGRLIRLAADEHALLLTQHHIVSDGWSLGVLVKEVTTLYAAFVEGRADPLPPLPIQYADYAVWQRGWLQGEALEAQVAFWREHLRGAPPLLELPTDRPRPPVQSYAGAVVPVALSKATTAGLRRLSKRHGTTLFMTLLAGWSALLSRYSGQQEVVVGTPVANRQRTEVEPLVGFFVNTLALRVSVEHDPSVAELLGQVRRSTLDAYSHQDVPFEQVVEALQPQRSLSYSPIFQTLFAFNNTPEGGEVPLPGLSLSPIPAERHTTHFDLELGVREVEDVIRGNIGYAGDLFDAATIGRLADSFVRMLEAMVADDSVRVSALPLLSEAGRAAIVEGFNATAADHGTAASLPELFAAQVRRTPEAPAIGFEGDSVSYAELDRRANRVAQRLIALGVKPDDRVAICVERGIGLVAGVLGIVKAGAGYVPLDPAYPPDRLRYMLENSTPSALVSQAALLARLPLLGACTAPLLDIDDGSCDAMPDSDPAVPGIGPDHLAYVIYTSGSTGLPKGVAMPQGPLLNLLAWQRGADAEASTPERVLQFAALGFDVAFQELFHTLGTGGCLLPVREEVRQDPFALAAFIERHGVQRIFLPFVAFQGLVAAAEQEGRALPTLRHVITAGEQLFVTPAIRAFFARMPGRRLHNQYGPTETHVATAHTLDALPEHWGATPPIGRPIANARAYLLDAHGQPVPVGVTGELFLAGDCIARGYLNREDLTAERFLPDPFSSRPGARMYRTGDLGRWLPNGEIDYLGRNDFQVKIRGFRVELGEIEAKLGQCAGVREAVVMAHEDGAGGKRLVAYLQVRPGEAPGAAALRAELARELADYMIPAAFVTLDAWPTTPSGKIDRKALPDPGQAAVASREYVAPEGGTEQALAGIWCALLNIERVGRDDHFFELGGHSLLAVQLVAHVRARLGVELPLRTIFAEPTLSGLAGALSGQARASVDAIPRADRAAALPLSWAQQRLWFLAQLDPAAGVAYHIPAALRLKGHLDRDALKRALDRIVARHENLRTSFTSTDAGPVQSIAAETIGFALVEEDLASLDAPAREQALRARAAEEARAPFDLAAGPLFRGRLIRLAADEHALLLTQHHIVSDGWSLGVLVKEVTTLYAAFVEGRADPLPPLPIQYADYAVWQRGWLQGEALEAQVAFWREHLRGAPPLLELPTDRPRPPVQSYAGAVVPVALSKATTAGLRRLSKRHGTTLFMTLLAGWSALLSRYSGQQEVVVGTPVANRQRTEVEPLVGFFVNTLALRVSVEHDPSVAELLGQVRRSTLDAYSHQDVPFEQVVEALQPQRSLSYSPLFQTMLSLDNTPDAKGASMRGLRAEPLRGERNTVHSDLDLSLVEHDDGIAGSLAYSTALFERATVERLAQALHRLLDAMIADPSMPVGRLPLLDHGQRARVLEAFNATTASYPREATIHGLFEAQARRTPAATAVADDGRRLSYAELDARAEALARRLRAQGVRPDDRVAFCAGRDVDLLVGILGILKAGAGYVPLDPSYPEGRLRYLLSDSAPRVIVTTRALDPLRPLLAETGLPVLYVESMETAEDASASTIADVHRSSQLAYVIYTSGSTGHPKGVEVEHRSAINLWASLEREVFSHCRADARVALNAAFSFDASLQMLLQVLSGRCVRLVPASVRADGAAMIGFLRREQIEAFDCTPAQLELLLDAGALESGRLPALRTILVGGEAISRTLWERAAASDVACFNVYGPTECTVDATLARIEAGVPPNIGRGIANTRIYLLDAYGQPVPEGVCGELHIGGEGVARGYLNREDLTAERFRADPFSTVPGARMYRTGDLGRWRSDGVIEYLGRNDFQIKIRGFRIEPGEIEAALARGDGIREAVVLVREDAAGDKRLVAYVRVDDGTAVDAASLRAALSQQLPEHMLPSAFVTMTALPLTPNGKVDRDALPAPDGTAIATRAHVAPEGEEETVLAEIWGGLLGLERVGRHDHFFELGGHSLLAVRMFAAVRERFGTAPPLSAVFATPVLSALAERLSQARRNEDAGVSAVALQTIRRDTRPLFCIHPVGGEIAMYRALAGRLAPVCPVYALPSPEAVGEGAIRDIDALVARHVECIRSVQPQGPYRLAGWSSGGLFAAAVANRLVESGAAVEYLGLIDSHPLPDGPLDDEVLIALALRAELGARGIAVDAAWIEAFTASGRPLSAFVASSPEEALRHAGIDAVPGLDAPLLTQLLNQLPKTAAHLAALRDGGRPTVAVAVHHVRAASQPAPATPPVAAPAGESTRVVTGTHHSMLMEPAVAEVAACIAGALGTMATGDGRRAATSGTEAMA